MVFLHTLQPTYALKRKKRVGRGGKRGTFSGRGTKGQKARAGAKIRPQEREEILKIPKKRGSGFINRPKKFKARIAVINLGTINKHFAQGELVTPKTLTRKGLLDVSHRSATRVKILGAGKLSKKINFSNVFVSEQARAAIESIGGTIT